MTEIKLPIQEYSIFLKSDENDDDGDEMKMK